MRQFKRRRDPTLRRIGGILIKLKLFDGDLKRRRREFVNVAFHQNVRREKFLVENDFEFLIGRPVFSWYKKQMFVSGPQPPAGKWRIESDAGHRCFFQILQARRGLAESDINRGKL